MSVDEWHQLPDDPVLLKQMILQREAQIEQIKLVLPRSPMAGAIGYTLNQWQALCRHSEADSLDNDTKAAERALKREDQADSLNATEPSSTASAAPPA